MQHPLAASCALLALVALTGCAAVPAASSQGGTASNSPTAPQPAPTATVRTPPPAVLSLVLEPNQGMGAIYAMIAAARHSIDLTMYELEDTTAERSLTTDAARGVNVRVILDRAYVGSTNAGAYAYLLSHGVHVRWATSLYALTHQKTLTVDGVVSVIMTLNWTSRYYSDTRDVGVIDRTPADIAAIESVFNADYAGDRVTPGAGADLVWSPTTALPDLLDFINGSRHELLVENEEMDNSDVTNALINAARRGVDVSVCMTNSSSWTTAFRGLTAAGVHVRVYSPSAALYIHAKVLVRDRGSGEQAAFVGSQNFSTESLRYNRELGVILHSSTLIDQLSSMVQQDFNGAARWS